MDDVSKIGARKDPDELLRGLNASNLVFYYNTHYLYYVLPFSTTYIDVNEGWLIPHQLHHLRPLHALVT
jgi:hypothetical protein